MTVVLIAISVVVLVAAVVGAVAVRSRRQQSIEASLRQFRDGLAALDPANDPLSRRAAAKAGSEAADRPSRTGSRPG